MTPERSSASSIGPARRVGVDVRAALALCGVLLTYLGLSALFPVGVALWYHEPIWPFVGAGAAAATAGFALQRLDNGRGRVGFREGYLIVSLTWLLAALFGAIPFMLAGEPQLDRPVDALFESMSGFTTTGASVLTDIEAVDRSLLMWRQFIQWLGGMGIIVLALAVLPRLRVGGRQLMETEMPGPEVDDLATRIRSTAQRLWLLYVGLTAAAAAAFLLVHAAGRDDEMTPFNALAHAFTTLPTGGFSPEARSAAGFSPITQWVMVVFMLLAGLNFALLYRLFIRRQPRPLLTDPEAKLWIAIVVVMSALLTLEVWREGIASGEAAVRTGTFQVVSLITTTGFASIDFAPWPAFALMILVALMFVGGSAGSTAGSIKAVRHLLLARVLRRELHQTVHPEAIEPIRLRFSAVDERTLRAVIAFILLYVGLFVVGAGIVALDAAFQGPRISTLDAIAAAATTLGNVGPGLGLAGPMGSFEPYSDLSSMTLIGLMWLGRLEIIPLLVLLTRGYWRV